MNRQLHNPVEDDESSAYSRRSNMISRKLLVIIPLGIIGNIIWCLATTDKHSIGSLLHVDPVFLAIAGLLSVVPWFTGSLRLFAWSRFLGHPVSYHNAISIVVTADLGSAITPPVIGGGAVKTALLINRGLSAGQALSLPVLENLEDGLFFLFLVPLTLSLTASTDLAGLFDRTSLPGALRHAGAGFSALIVILLAVTIVAMLRPRPFKEKIMATVRTFLDTFRLIGSSGKRVLALTLLLTGIQWTCRYSIISFLFAGLGIPVDPLLFMMLQVAVFALTTLLPSPGGIGGAEFFFSLLYGPFLPSGTLGISTTLWRFFTFYLHTILAALFVLVAGRARPYGIRFWGTFRPKEELGLARK